MVVGSSPNRKVLIVEDEASIRNVLFVLLASLGCEADIAHSSGEAFAMIGRESFDAVLLDLRCHYAPTEEVVAKIKELQPSLLGRVLVIAGEVEDVETMQMIGRHCLPHISRYRLAQDLCDRLRKILGIAKSPLHTPS
jgi:DNA-binding NtrC family response regulator